MAITPSALAGKRVLIVEDELLVALLIEDFLVDLGCTTLGPCSSVAAAMAITETERFDIAVLDVNLAGETVYPVAELLSKRHIPFMFLSGYGEDAIPIGRTDWRVCAKPFRGREFEAMLSSVLAAADH